MAIPGSLQFTTSPPVYKEAPVSVAKAITTAVSQVSSATGVPKFAIGIPSGDGIAKTSYGGIQSQPSSGTPMVPFGSPKNEVSIDNTTTAKFLTLAVIVAVAYFIFRWKGI